MAKYSKAKPKKKVAPKKKAKKKRSLSLTGQAGKAARALKARNERIKNM